MSISTNDMNPATATELPSDSSNDVILNVEGRNRMRRPYERCYMQQTTQKPAKEPTPSFSTNTAKPTKGRSLYNAKFLSIISIFCAVFLLTVFAFDYLLAKNSNISLATDSVSASFVKDKVSANQVNATAEPNPNSINQSIETQNEMQNSDGEIGMIKVKTMLSEDDFKQEAKNTLFRDSEKNRGYLLAIQTNHRPDTTIQQDINQEEFGVEAKNILYREEDISEAYKNDFKQPI